MSRLFEPVKNATITWIEGWPYASAYDEFYCSATYGVQEAQEVFIEGNRLVERWTTLSASRFVIGEIGFGTGLNFLLAWSAWERVAPEGSRLHVISSEKHPLSRGDLGQCLALWPALAEYATALLDAYPVLTPGYHRLVFSGGRVVLDLMLGDPLACHQDRLLCGSVEIEQELRRDHVDAWFLDGFSPDIDSDMWSDALFAMLFQLSNKSTTLSAPTTEGRVTQALALAGFEVDERPVHDKKTEMLVACVGTPLKPTPLKCKTPWHVAPVKRIKAQHRQAIVIGAGLSGCLTAHALAQRGWQVRVLEKQSAVGQGASGNHHSILFPNVSAYRAPMTELMLSAFLYASRFYRQYLKYLPMADFSGILQLVRDQKTAQTQMDLAAWLLAYPELGRCVDAAEASELSGVDVLSGGIYIPMAGWVDSPALCERLVQHPRIEVLTNMDPKSLQQTSLGHWHVAGYEANVVVITTGYAANQFPQTKHLEIQSVRGQMTGVQASQYSQALQIPLCGDGHILPHVNGFHAIGATFSKDCQDGRCLSQDDDENHIKIKALSACLELSKTVVSHWAGIRGTTSDHLPIVGPVADAPSFSEVFARLGGDANRWIPSGGTYLNGLYIATGFGSRGLTTIPLCVEYLASLINHEPSPLPQSLVQAISPARFLHRDLCRNKK